MSKEQSGAFLALAREDVAVARTVLDAFPRHADFAVQQAAEKLVKAVLTAAGIPAPPNHQIGNLAARLPVDHPWRADLSALDRLSAAATAYRYPSLGGHLPQPRKPSAILADIERVEALLARADVLLKPSR